MSWLLQTVMILHIHFGHIVGDFFRIDHQKWNYCPRTEVYEHFTDISCTYFYAVDTANTQDMSCCILVLTYLVSIRVPLNVDFPDGRIQVHTFYISRPVIAQNRGITVTLDMVRLSVVNPGSQGLYLGCVTYQQVD